MDKKYASRDSYSGRFGESADINRRPTGSYRNQPAGSYRSRAGYEDARKSTYRPSIRDGGDSYTRRPAKKQDSVRSRKKTGRLNLKRLLVVLIAVAITAAIAWFFISNSGKTVHMMPTIERVAQTSEETAVTP